QARSYTGRFCEQSGLQFLVPCYQAFSLWSLVSFPMRLTYYGHSCFLLETAKARLLLDPFLTDNTSAKIKAAEVECDFILISHGHEDHSCDALEIAERCNATIVANYEIAEYFAAKDAKAHGMNPGGGFNFPFGRVKLTLAHHTSSVEA